MIMRAMFKEGICDNPQKKENKDLSRIVLYVVKGATIVYSFWKEDALSW